MKQWYKNRKKDHFYLKAKKNSFISRAYYKLEEIDRKKQLITKNCRVLDIGCAPGGWSQVALEINPKIEITAIDILDLKINHPQINFYKDDFLNFDYDKRNQKFQTTSGFFSNYSVDIPVLSDTNTLMNSYNYKIFKELYDKWFVHKKPTRCKNVHVKSEWITPALAKSSDTKNTLYQQWRKHRTNKNWNLYITYKRKLDTLKNKVKYDYYTKKFINCKSNTKKVWQLINHVLGRKKRNSVYSLLNLMMHAIILISILHQLPVI